MNSFDLILHGKQCQTCWGVISSRHLLLPVKVPGLPVKLRFNGTHLSWFLPVGTVKYETNFQGVLFWSRYKIQQECCFFIELFSHKLLSVSLCPIGWFASTFWLNASKNSVSSAYSETLVPWYSLMNWVVIILVRTRTERHRHPHRLGWKGFCPLYPHYKSSLTVADPGSGRRGPKIFPKILLTKQRRVGQVK